MKRLLILTTLLLTLTFNLHAQDERKIKENIVEDIIGNSTNITITSMIIMSKDNVTERLFDEAYMRKANDIADASMLEIAGYKQRLAKIEQIKKDQPDRWKTDKKFKDGLLNLQKNITTDLEKKQITTMVCCRLPILLASVFHQPIIAIKIDQDTLLIILYTRKQII